MFERWLKSKSSAPTALDLTRHHPHEFEGKVVTLNGRDYTIGRKVRQTDQGFAHRLTNALSGLCLHVIQIRPEYMQSPNDARLVGRVKEQEYASLRNSMLVKDPVQANALGVVTAWDAHGGTFEIHEVPWGMFGNDGSTPADEQVSLAYQLSANGDPQRYWTAQSQNARTNR